MALLQLREGLDFGILVARRFRLAPKAAGYLALAYANTAAIIHLHASDLYAAKFYLLAALRDDWPGVMTDLAAEDRAFLDLDLPWLQQLLLAMLVDCNLQFLAVELYTM